ncbi:MAG TPA: gliding motility-associated C-terminal domain-containing protein, partial [Cytophagaceae bacterium]
KIAGVYTVTVVSDGCSAYDFATVKVISPYGDAGGDSITSTLKACFGFPVDIKAKLYNHTENTIYWWEPGNAVTLLDYLHEETDLDPTFVAPAAGVYKYYLFVEEPGTGCKAVMDSVNIIIHSLPSIEAMAGKNPVCIGGEAELFVTSLLSDKYTYFWYKDGETEPFVSGDSVKSVVYNATNNFMVVAIDSNLCVDTVNVVVSAIEKQNLKIPNLLTPNGDGYNDTFLIMDDVGRALLPGAKLEVYNRWGTRVFRTNDYDNNWTPDIVDGVYYYDLTPGCGNEVKRGWIHIINNEGNVGRTE